MATPAVAGNAAAIRQYFKDPKFWAASCDPTYDLCGSLDPRGATVKAVLLHSGEQMTQYTGSTGTTEATTSIGTTPDFYQGKSLILIIIYVFLFLFLILILPFLIVYADLIYAATHRVRTCPAQQRVASQRNHCDQFRSIRR